MGDLRGKKLKRKKESKAKQIGIPRKGDQRIFLLVQLNEQNLSTVQSAMESGHVGSGFGLN